MAIGAAKMPLLEHLGELRMRLVRIVVCLLVCVCVFYFAAPTLSQFLLLPIADFLPKGANGGYMLTAIDPFETFAVRFTVAMWFSFVACSPIILWQLLAFFLPALKPEERKWFIPTFVAAVILFVAGVIFCYFAILPPAFQWLTQQGEGFADVLPRAKSYIGIIIGFEVGFGVAFELPLVVFYLVLFEVIPYKKLRENWRVVYIVLLVFSSLITLDASPITMALMFAAMLVLYEGSLLVARVALGRRIKKRELDEDDYEAELDRTFEETKQLLKK